MAKRRALHKRDLFRLESTDYGARSGKRHSFCYGSGWWRKGLRQAAEEAVGAQECGQTFC